MSAPAPAMTRCRAAIDSVEALTPDANGWRGVDCQGICFWREASETAVELIHGAIALFEGEFVGDGGAAGREDGKLDLRHGRGLIAPDQNCQTGFIGFPGEPATSRERSGWLRLFGKPSAQEVSDFLVCSPKTPPETGHSRHLCSANRCHSNCGCPGACGKGDAKKASRSHERLFGKGPGGWRPPPRVSGRRGLRCLFAPACGRWRRGCACAGGC